MIYGFLRYQVSGIFGDDFYAAEVAICIALHLLDRGNHGGRCSPHQVPCPFTEKRPNSCYWWAPLSFKRSDVAFSGRLAPKKDGSTTHRPKMLLQVAVNPSLSKRIVVVTSRYTRDFEKLTASCKTGCSKELELMLGLSPLESFVLTDRKTTNIHKLCVHVSIQDAALYNDLEMFVGCLLYFIIMQAQNQFFCDPFVTPWKISMEHNHEDLEDDFPFQLDEFDVPC